MRRKGGWLLAAGAVPMLGISLPPPTPPPAPVATAWYQDVLGAIPAPDSPTNEQSLQLWARSEDVAPSDFNWLATTLTGTQYPTTHLIAPNNGNPVLAYASYAVGVAATAQTIRNHPNILAAFQSGSSSAAVYHAVNDSAWCWRCQSGLYPAALLNAPAPAVPAPTQPPPAPTQPTTPYVPLLANPS